MSNQIIKPETLGLASALTQDIAKELCAKYHFRDAVKNHDGSLGTVKISPSELTGLIELAIIEYVKRCQA